ncbi:MAG: SpoIIE family protein phosphatase [Magnetospirillum sp.]|nr:SpoIIE family protein phosphatase [Magnetospirillum sp.]
MPAGRPVDDDDPLAIETCRVLVVEDNVMNRMVAASFLKGAGIVDIVFAGDGIEGLAKIEADRPDLVLLDLMMPHMDGHEFLRRLRAMPEHADLPVLVVTALSGVGERNAVFALGATDYIEKPVNGRELVARVRIHLRNRVLLRGLRTYRDRIAQDLDILRSMQTSMLPSPQRVREVAEQYGIGVHSFFEASFELGGDLWGLVPLDEERLGVWALDFSGHGVAAAVNTFRLHLLLGRAGVSMAHPNALLRELNAALYAILPRGQFATMVYAVIDIAAGTLSFASAAAPSLMIGQGADIHPYTIRGLPLGIVENTTYEVRTLPFPKGSILCLASDALLEIPDKTGRVLGEEGAVDLVRETAATCGPQPLSCLMDAFRGPEVGTLDDDLTLVWVSRDE